MPEPIGPPDQAPQAEDAWSRIKRGLRPVYLEIAFASLFVNLLALVVPIFVLQVYDRVIGHNGLTTLQGLAAGVGFALLFDYMLRQLRSRVLQRAALLIDATLATELFRRFLQLPLSVLETRPASYWQTLFRDVEVVRNTLGGATAVLLVDLPFGFLFLGVIFIFATPVGWVLLVLLPLFLGVTWWSGRSLGAAGRTEQSQVAARDAMLSETIAGRTTAKALALGGTLAPTWDTRQAAIMRAGLFRGQRNDGFANISTGLASFSTVAMTTVGALAIIDQHLTIGALIAANMLSGRILQPLNQLVASWRGIVAYRQSVARLREALALPQELQSTSIQLPEPKGQIELQAVAFAYGEKAPPVFDGLSLKLPAGGVHAIVGRNGCGKSTLLKLLLGLYRPRQGRVLLDGVDIAQVGRVDLAAWTGYLPQECVLVQGSIRDNIRGGHAGLDDAAILEAARLAGVHAAIVDLPEGYGTPVGEGGLRLSGGQRQRVALARALAAGPPLLLLDEPTASLDRRAEEELRQVLLQLAGSRTIVVVTHSPLLLSIANSVTVLDGGRAVASGPPREILPRFFGAPAPVAAVAT